MDPMLTFKAIVLAVVCGVTEFLPISSNGHVLILDEFLGFEGPPGKLFEISLQLGAILAVCWYYRHKLAATLVGAVRNPAERRFALGILIACIPAVVIGACFHRFITEHLFNARVVAVMLVAGGVVILLVERFKPAPRIFVADEITLKTALMIGLFQAVAMIPGISRSGATIMGAMSLGVERRAATEFSFFLAIPMICMASFFDLFVHRYELNAHGLGLIATGLIVSFVCALIVIKWLLTYLGRHGFTAFAWYRIVMGGLVLLLLALR